ncbi:MAG: NUDIX hydrolase [Deltaproteobacteria bacterium]|nr:NUDIX hydrolase [Deltaproteobacteria bacterium]
MFVNSVDSKTPTSTPIPAASVILFRRRAGAEDLETFLLRRHRRSSFMSDTFVFPGGRVESDDGDPETAAIRELFEEAGVLLARGDLSETRRTDWRRRLNAGEASLGAMIAEESLELDRQSLHLWARWITPSVEPKRFDAYFFLAEVPEGQSPSFDQKETVEEAWVTPAEAISRNDAGQMKLPPPQLRTMTELLPHSRASTSTLARIADERRQHVHPIMPRLAMLGGNAALLLPWDPDYAEKGTGEACPMPPGHLLGTGPSRFILDGAIWRLSSP